MPVDRARTFIALEIPQAVKARCAEFQSDLAGLGTDVKWVEPENIHVTLKFLGAVERAKLGDVAVASDQAAVGVEPFEVTFVGLGSFPNTRSPRVLWIGVNAGGSELHRLAGELERLLEAQGFPRETRPFHAHLTLGRLRSDRGARAIGERLATGSDTMVGGTTAQSIVVFESKLSPRGPRYEKVHESRIGKGGP